MLHHEMAQLYLLQNKRGEGITFLTRALTLAPENIPGTLLLADLHVAANTPGEIVDARHGVFPQRRLAAGQVFREWLMGWPEKRQFRACTRDKSCSASGR